MNLLQQFDRFFGRLPRTAVLLVTTSMLVGLGYLDYLSGYHVSFALFYFIPVYLSTWYGGRLAGIMNSIVAATIWMVATIHSGFQFPSAWVAAWDFVDRFGIFALVSLLFGTLHNWLRTESRQAGTDPLTGLLNRRAFYVRVDEESERLKRYRRPFTLVYIDLDNFKTLNDTRGHAEGDELLRVFGNFIRRSTRRSDVAARLGGDEFAALFPETDPVRAESTLTKLISRLNALMEEHGWPVTISAGAVTFFEPMGSVEEMVQAADALMYTVKRSSKNAFRHGTWPKRTSSEPVTPAPQAPWRRRAGTSDRRANREGQGTAAAPKTLLPHSTSARALCGQESRECTRPSVSRSTRYGLRRDVAWVAKTGGVGQGRPFRRTTSENAPGWFLMASSASARPL